MGGRTTDRMRDQSSTVEADEAHGIGARLVSLVPAISNAPTLPAKSIDRTRPDARRRQRHATY
jgi:hypothetical protein